MVFNKRLEHLQESFAKQNELAASNPDVCFSRDELKFTGSIDYWKSDFLMEFLLPLRIKPISESFAHMWETEAAISVFLPALYGDRWFITGTGSNFTTRKIFIILLNVQKLNLLSSNM